MVDIHTHILWGVDDGARSIEESLDMLRMAADCGTTDIVATPHANSTYPFNLQVLNDRYHELSSRHRGLPRMHRGCDFHLSAGNIQDALDHPTKYTINGGRHLMVELPEMFSPPAIENALALLLAKGMVPVITHPERNPVLQRSPEVLQSWIDRGCLGQVTAQSFSGRFGNRAKSSAWHFLRAGNIHFAASDAHDTKHRPPRIDQAYDLLKEEIGEFAARSLVADNPQAVIENRDDAMEITLESPPRKWYQRWSWW